MGSRVISVTPAASGNDVQPVEKSDREDDLVPGIQPSGVEVIGCIVGKLMPQIAGARFAFVVEWKLSNLLPEGAKFDFWESFYSLVEVVHTWLRQQREREVSSELFNFEKRARLRVAAVFGLEEIAMDPLVAQLVDHGFGSEVRSNGNAMTESETKAIVGNSIVVVFSRSLVTQVVGLNFAASKPAQIVLQIRPSAKASLRSIIQIEAGAQVCEDLIMVSGKQVAAVTGTVAGRDGPSISASIQIGFKPRQVHDGNLSYVNNGVASDKVFSGNNLDAFGSDSIVGILDVVCSQISVLGSIIPGLVGTKQGIAGGKERGFPRAIIGRAHSSSSKIVFQTLAAPCLAVALQSDRSFGGDLAGCLVESNAVGIKRRFSVLRIFILDDDAVFCRSHAGIGIVRETALFGRRLNFPLGALLSGKARQGVDEEETGEEKPPDESHEERTVAKKEGFGQVSCEKSRRLYPMGKTGSAEVLPATPGV